MGNTGVFGKAKSKKLAALITIRSARAFKESVRKVSRGGLTGKEKKALVLARTRATLSLRRKNLSKRERIQMRAISKIKIGPVTTQGGKRK